MAGCGDQREASNEAVWGQGAVWNVRTERVVKRDVCNLHPSPNIRSINRGWWKWRGREREEKRVKLLVEEIKVKPRYSATLTWRTSNSVNRNSLYDVFLITATNYGEQTVTLYRCCEQTVTLYRCCEQTVTLYRCCGNTVTLYRCCEQTVTLYRLWTNSDAIPVLWTYSDPIPVLWTHSDTIPVLWTNSDAIPVLDCRPHYRETLKVSLKTGCEDADWIPLSQNRVQRRATANSTGTGLWNAQNAITVAVSLSFMRC
jgi:hypothetical protein